MNSSLEVQMPGSDGHIYQIHLKITRSRNDQLAYDASEFVNQLTKKLKDKKESQIDISGVSNLGLSRFSLFVSYLPFFFTNIIAYPVLIYFQLYQEIDRNLLLQVCFRSLDLEEVRSLFFQLRQFFDYRHEARFIIFGVNAYRFGVISVQSLDSTNFITLLLIKCTCKVIWFWIEVYGYQELLEQKKQLYMSFIRDSIVDQSKRKNQLLNRPTLDL